MREERESAERRIKARPFGDTEGGDYEVLHYADGPCAGEIKGIKCCLCDHMELRMEHRRGTDRSGLARYNRMRVAMARHVNGVHRG